MNADRDSNLTGKDALGNTEDPQDIKKVVGDPNLLEYSVSTPAKAPADTIQGGQATETSPEQSAQPTNIPSPELSRLKQYLEESSPSLKDLSKMRANASQFVLAAQATKDSGLTDEWKKAEEMLNIEIWAKRIAEEDERAAIEAVGGQETKRAPDTENTTQAEPVPSPLANLIKYFEDKAPQMSREYLETIESNELDYIQRLKEEGKLDLAKDRERFLEVVRSIKESKSAEATPIVPKQRPAEQTPTEGATVGVKPELTEDERAAIEAVGGQGTQEGRPTEGEAAGTPDTAPEIQPQEKAPDQSIGQRFRGMFRRNKPQPDQDNQPAVPAPAEGEAPADQGATEPDEEADERPEGEGAEPAEEEQEGLDEATETTPYQDLAPLIDHSDVTRHPDATTQPEAAATIPEEDHGEKLRKTTLGEDAAREIEEKLVITSLEDKRGIRDAIKRALDQKVPLFGSTYRDLTWGFATGAATRAITRTALTTMGATASLGLSAAVGAAAGGVSGMVREYLKMKKEEEYKGRVSELKEKYANKNILKREILLKWEAADKARLAKAGVRGGLMGAVGGAIGFAAVDFIADHFPSSWLEKIKNIGTSGEASKPKLTPVQWEQLRHMGGEEIKQLNNKSWAFENIRGGAAFKDNLGATDTVESLREANAALQERLNRLNSINTRNLELEQSIIEKDNQITALREENNALKARTIPDGALPPAEGDILKDFEDLIPKDGIVPLASGSSPWKTVEEIGSKYLERQLTTPEKVQLTKILLQESSGFNGQPGINVPGWGITGENLIDERRVPSGYKLNFNSKVLDVLKSFKK